MKPRKTVLTTGDVARICCVAPRTVSKWFDAGRLRGYRIPGSKDRRIPVDQLIRFMRAHGIPLNGLDGGEVRVVVLDGDPALADSIAKALHEKGGFQVCATGSVIEAGAAATELHPQAIVIDVAQPDVVPASIVRWVRSSAALDGTCLIATAINLSEARGQALLQDGFDAYLSKPFDLRALLSIIEKHRKAST